MVTVVGMVFSVYTPCDLRQFLNPSLCSGNSLSIREVVTGRRLGGTKPNEGTTRFYRVATTLELRMMNATRVSGSIVLVPPSDGGARRAILKIAEVVAQSEKS